MASLRVSLHGPMWPLQPPPYRHVPHSGAGPLPACLPPSLLPSFSCHPRLLSYPSPLNLPDDSSTVANLLRWARARIITTITTSQPPTTHPLRATDVPFPPPTGCPPCRRTRC